MHSTHVYDTYVCAYICMHNLLKIQINKGWDRYRQVDAFQPLITTQISTTWEGYNQKELHWVYKLHLSSLFVFLLEVNYTTLQTGSDQNVSCSLCEK